MTTSGVITRMELRIARPVARWFDAARHMRLPLLVLYWLVIGPLSSLISLDLSLVHARRRTARHHPYQQLSQRIHNDGHDKQREPDLDQRAQIQVVGGLAEFV